jgi:hypothetical protein
VLGGAPAGKHAERRLELREDRRLTRREAHVAGQHELAAGGAHATFDLCDGHETARAEMVEQQRDRRLAGELRRLLSVFRDPRQVHVGDEVVGVCALEHQQLERRVCLGSLDERDEIADQLGAEEVHRRGRDFGEQHGPIEMDGQRLEHPRIRC